jgi:hypothetical protein
MACKDDHIKQASHNEKFYNQLIDTKFLDWGVTALFYSGLHYVDCYLSTVKNLDNKHAHPPTHEVRTPIVAKESNLRHIFPHYRRLKDQSEAARYRVKSFNRTQVEALKENDFETIKSHISNYL